MYETHICIYRFGMFELLSRPTFLVANAHIETLVHLPNGISCPKEEVSLYVTASLLLY
jgi:hypothetical protein